MSSAKPQMSLFWPIWLLVSCFAHRASSTALVKITAFKTETSDHLRVQTRRSNEKFFEERMFDGLLASVADIVAEIAPSLHIRLASNKEAAVTRIFERIHLTAETSRLFESTQFQQLAKIMSKAFPEETTGYEALYSELVKFYGDEKLAVFVAEGMNIPKTKDIAEIYQGIQFDAWSTKADPVQYAYDVLRLGEVRGNMFHSPLLKIWATFAKKKIVSTSVTSSVIFDFLFRMLKKSYSEENLIVMLGTANDVAESQTDAGMVATALFRHWDVTKGSAALKLEQTDLNEIDYSFLKLRILYDQAKMTYNDFKEHMEALIDGASGFNAARVIAILQEHKSTSDLAAKELPKLLQSWKNNELASDTVLTILQLDIAEFKDMQESPIFSIWLSYCDEIGVLLSELRKFSDEQLANILAYTKYNENFREKLDAVQTLIFEEWKQTYNLKQLFYRLGLDEINGNIFESPALSTLLTFAFKSDVLDIVSAISPILQQHVGNYDEFAAMVFEAAYGNMPASNVAQMLYHSVLQGQNNA
ncbi:hypothetical protein CCR75_007317 [Bremia lactucae]|uniref:RxLR effector protein n=1 Tax=Bremia lactucae TaxID=4779 RepID=A0A976FHZ4_BRELC|nr:hypothetical protein CCR75_007317 [Bremia lactucae]